MTEHKTLINEIATEARSILGEGISSSVIADNKIVYDIQITSSDSPSSHISFSHDVDTGYYIDINDVTYEYGNDIVAFRREATKFINQLKIKD